MADQGADATPAHQVIAKWREKATEWRHGIGENHYSRTLEDCADEVEAALAVSLQGSHHRCIRCGHSWVSQFTTAEYCGDCHRSALAAVSPQGCEPIDIEAMRGNLHGTFNGGWRETETIDAFHHGMDTVCNVLASYQKGGSTNGILPSPPRVAAGPEEQ